MLRNYVLGFLHFTFANSFAPSSVIFFDSSHFQAAVERIFTWLDTNNEQFLSAHQPQLVSTLRDVVTASTRWAHVHFIVLPVPYTASLLATFAQFMQEFNNLHELPSNVVSRLLFVGKAVFQ